MPEGAAGDAASEARSSAVAGIQPLPLPNRSCHRSDSPSWTRCPRPLLASAASKSVSLSGWCDPSELLFRLFVAVRRSGLTPVCKRQNRRSRGILKFTGLSTTFLRYPPDFFTVHSVVHHICTPMSTEMTSCEHPASASQHNKRGLCVPILGTQRPLRHATEGWPLITGQPSIQTSPPWG